MKQRKSQQSRSKVGPPFPAEKKRALSAKEPAHELRPPSSSPQPAATSTASCALNGQGETRGSHERLPLNKWNFSKVADHERPACLLYEMSRECETFMVHQVAKDWWARSQGFDLDAMINDQKLVTLPPEEQQRATNRLELLKTKTGFDQETFEKAYDACPHARNTFFHTCVEFVNQHWPSWIELPDEARKKFVDDYKNGRPFDVRIPAVADMELHWKDQLAKLDALRNRPENRGDVLLQALSASGLLVEPHFRNGTIHLTLAFNVDDYSNAQLREACYAWLGTWVPDNRPKDYPEPQWHGKGKSTEVWPALLGLGCMRALAVYTFRHPQFPQELKALGESECNRLRRLAGDRFHAFFPFLPTSEKPISWPTATDRRRTGPK